MKGSRLTCLSSHCTGPKDLSLDQILQRARNHEDTRWPRQEAEAQRSISTATSPSLARPSPSHATVSPNPLASDVPGAHVPTSQDAGSVDWGLYGEDIMIAADPEDHAMFSMAFEGYQNLSWMDGMSNSGVETAWMRDEQ